MTDEELKAERERAQKLVKETKVTIEALTLWMQTRASSSYGIRRVLTDPRSFQVEAEHSLRGGLLGYILMGGTPHEHPPPTCFSRPWHGLIDAGPEGVKISDSFVRIPSRFRERGASIGQDGMWELEQELGTNDFVISYQNLGMWQITREPELPGDEKGFGPLWWLRPYVPAVAG